MDELILVDLYDQPIGHAPKMAAHQEGRLHRAFSLFVVSGGCMLIHRRARGKYHSGGLWTNACCSHPRWGETLQEAVARRADQELGLRLDACPPEVFSFVYRADFGDLSEYEFDHVFLLDVDGRPALSPDASEIEEVAWVPLDELAQRLLATPEQFTVWFATAAPRILQQYA